MNCDAGQKHLVNLIPFFKEEERLLDRVHVACRPPWTEVHHSASASPHCISVLLIVSGFQLVQFMLLHELWAPNDIDAGGWHASCTCPSGMHLETQTLTGMCCVCTLADWQQSADLAGNSGLRCTRPLPCLLTSCLRLWQAELLSLYTRCFTPFW